MMRKSNTGCIFK